MTNKEEKFVLSFFPNQLGFGFSFLSNAYTVKDSQIVTARPMSNKSLMSRIREYVDIYEPEVVVLEDYNGKQSRKSKRIIKLIDEITEYAKTKNIPVASYSREQIKFVFSQFNARSKWEIAKAITESIPKLASKLKPKRKPHQAERYSMGIFDAVSLAITHYYFTD